MGIIDSTFVHTCQILSTSQDQRLDFVSGSVIFTVGKTLTGATSKAIGIIKTVTLSTGTWDGTAAGYLILHAVSGAFVNGEIIQDNNTTKGTATTSGVLIPQTNAAGTPTTTSLTLPSNSTYYDCLFDNTSLSGVTQSSAGDIIISTPCVFLPSSSQVREGDQVTTTETNWKGTYTVEKVDCPGILGTGIVDHKEAFLKKVVKRG